VKPDDATDIRSISNLLFDLLLLVMALLVSFGGFGGLQI
jgi:hypothetical protein